MVLSRADAVEWAAGLRRQGRALVFTNGVFDLLHPGHVRYLRASRRLGDALLVGVNSDRSARAQGKGPDRPVNPDAERAEVLAALADVDAVVLFDEDTPLELITALRPNVLVKGADWGPDDIVGAGVVSEGGGRVERIALAEGYSTTEILRRIREAT